MIPVASLAIGLTHIDIGFYIGLGNAVAGLMGVSIGGYLADRWKLKHANGRLYVVFIGVALTIH